MRASQFPVSTVKETPADATVISHQLMLRAGLIRQLASGLYTWMPYGLRVLRKVEAIVREEMENAGGVELLMPGIQPAELWSETGRWEKYGPELLRLTDRHNNDFCVGPTHEEVITDTARRDIRSYKQLPMTYFQVQTKFRDEVRPRFGVMRAREFIMKDAYSFHLDQASLEATYQTMFDAYHNIFNRLGLNFRAVEADTGSIGGNSSHEFHVLAESGEDDIVFSTGSDYAANIELAECKPDTTRPAATQAMESVDTPKQRTIEDVCELMGISAATTVKTLLVAGDTEEHPVIALVLRGDHTVNDIKVEKHPLVAAPMTLVTDEQAEKASGCRPGSIGPVGLEIPIIVDSSAAVLADFVAGANISKTHYKGINWGRDLPEPEHVADIRNIEVGETSPDGNGTVDIKRGIEVGHIFQLGTSYSESMGATVLDQNGKNVVMTMGCYGIGVSRVVAAAIEQNHDDNGIIWPEAIAPFTVALVGMNIHKSDRTREACEKLYTELKAAGVDVLFDDRDARPGVKFADIELIGIPHRIVIGDRGLDKGMVEYRGRRDSDNQDIAVDEILNHITSQLA